MSASPESASGGPSASPETPAEVLISGLNWLGDSVMSMPAVQSFKLRYPEASITMLTKGWLVPLWRMHRSVDSVIELKEGFAGTLRTALALKGRGMGSAHIFPNSFRSALIPFLAGIPSRVGVAGHRRRWMLSRVVMPPKDSERRHQVFEYFRLMGLDDVDDPGVPSLSIPDEVAAGCRERVVILPDDRKLVGIMPGASHGPSKRWPAEKFAEAAECLVKEHGCAVVALGSAAEAPLCDSVVSGLGADAVNFAGKTSLAELAGMLSLCDAVVSNDSGGMHLASAVGVNVVAVFGITDASVTGPIGRQHRVIAAEGVNGARDLPRESDRAMRALESISVSEVCEAAAELLRGAE